MRSSNFSIVAVTCIVAVYAFYDPKAIDSFHRLPENANNFKPRIFEGIIPTKHSLPFVAFITSVEELEGRQRNCTGSIIASRYVLSALHCILRSDLTMALLVGITVRIGSQYKSKGRQFSVLEAYITDKSKRTPENYDDIVILKLKREIRFDNLTTAAITLGRVVPRIGETLTIAGHGTHIVQGWSYERDSYVVQNVTVQKNINYCRPKANEFCAGGLKRGAASGDSGGPAFKLVNKKYVQVGIIEGGRFIRKGYKISDWYDYEGKLIKNCTGSIIASRYVLTAWHCLLQSNNRIAFAQDITVKVGSQFKSKGKRCTISGIGGTDKNLKGSRRGNFDDIVILELYHEILFDFLTTGPILLSRSTPKVGETLMIAGHGTRIVQRRFLKSDSYAIGNITVKGRTPYCKPKANEFCAGGLNQGTVNDDSGGPAFKIVNRKYVQVAIIVGGEQYQKTDKKKREFELPDMYGYGKFLKIAPYCDYIQRSTAGAAYCQK